MSNIKFFVTTTKERLKKKFVLKAGTPLVWVFLRGCGSMETKQVKKLSLALCFTATMKEKFKKLADILRKKPNEACNALAKLFPEGLKMKWMTDKWEIAGMMAMDNKGGTNEIRMEVK